MKKISIVWTDDYDSKYEYAFDIRYEGKWMIFRTDENGVIHEYGLNTDHIYEIDIVEQGEWDD